MLPLGEEKTKQYLNLLKEFIKKWKKMKRNVCYRLEHQKERSSLWPAVGDHAGYGSGQRGKNYQNVNSLRSRKSKGGKEFVVKIFVGVEYECPRGHRFMASAPDKVLKATGSGIVKDSGNKVTSSTIDMPLYFACPCRFISSIMKATKGRSLNYQCFFIADKLNN
jgi:hypothetical protein